MQKLLEQQEISSADLVALLEARSEGKVDFVLVDVREDMEYNMGHIKGADMLKPTSTFNEWAQNLFDELKDKNVIFTCRTGNRSGQVQNVFRQNGHTKSINHYGGIVSYSGEIEQ